MPIHSSILVHWTGSDIEESSVENKAQRYVERLADDCENGLFAKRTTEAVIRHWKIKHLLRLCFTEIRLSQAETHAQRYGRLGIGFARDFIMNKGGRPVIYIPFEAAPDSRLLEECIRNIYDHSQHDKDIRRWAKWIMAHVKRMSNASDDDYFEEFEWRLVHNESDSNPHFRSAGGEGVYRMPFQPSDVKIVVFPDEAVKQMALREKRIRAFFSDDFPSMVTLTDCPDFSARAFLQRRVDYRYLLPYKRGRQAHTPHAGRRSV